jgi:hypothetical protein
MDDCFIVALPQWFGDSITLSADAQAAKQALPRMAWLLLVLVAILPIASGEPASQISVG